MSNASAAAKSLLSHRVAHFTESVIREMTRQAMQFGAVNLAQGFPDFPAPDSIKQAAAAAIAADINQYAITWGARGLRHAIAAKAREWHGLNIDGETEITVCCGSTEAMISALMAVTNPGDEIVLFEPFYENYGPDAILCGAIPRFVKLHAPANPDGDWALDPGELRAAFNSKTKAIIVNTPNNPTGKVFNRGELELIRELCLEFGALAITDEIYEHILYDGAAHIPLATLPDMSERTITISGMSKTYSVTGWRVGWAIAPPAVTGGIRKVHDFLTVGAAAPLQEAGALALQLPRGYYEELAAGYLHRRDRLLQGLRKAGFTAFRPRGAYYIMAGFSALSAADDVSFAATLVREIGVATVPGSSFFSNPKEGAALVRFAFCKRDATLDAALARLRKLNG
ncbi:MAG: aminotransferase class I/II-fold pyridoxal phosphate-dependent enzyme [Acidobacteria bacterium]|nr:aminotransferase class I/II-fold pyridoxal phosphate-dependent enzyme [Acidobacteriota bacterium]